MGHREKEYSALDLKAGEVQVEVFVAGDGVNYPRKGQTVVVHYTAYLQDGKKFDSSRDRDKPFKFKLGAEQVIPGLDEGIERLCMKERAKIYIPADKAYGKRGFPGLYPFLYHVSVYVCCGASGASSTQSGVDSTVPPNTNLVFDIELVTFK